MCLLEMLDKKPPFKDSKLKVRQKSLLNKIQCVYTVGTVGLSEKVEKCAASPELKDMMSLCLRQNPDERATALSLLQVRCDVFFLTLAPLPQESRISQIIPIGCSNNLHY